MVIVREVNKLPVLETDNRQTDLQKQTLLNTSRKPAFNAGNATATL